MSELGDVELSIIEWLTGHPKPAPTKGLENVVSLDGIEIVHLLEALHRRD